MIAANFDNFLFLLLVVVAVLFQFLAKMAGKKNKDQPTPKSTPRTPAPIQRPPGESNEDRVRKLLEALGQPPTSTPPPPVAPRSNIPPRPLAPVKPPMSPLSQLKRDKTPKREATPKEIPPPPLFKGGAEMIPPTITGGLAFEVHKGPSPITPAPVSEAPAQVYAVERRKVDKRDQPRADIAVVLGSSSGLRDAIILREILGPPRGLFAIDALL